MQRFVLLIAAIIFSGTCPGQDTLKKDRSFHLVLENGTGSGNKFLYTGIITNYGNDVIIYEGGGFPRLGLGAGYTWKKHFDVAAILGFQESVSIPPINNGSVYFDKTMLNAEFRYILFAGKRKRSHFNIGTGMVNFVSSIIDADFSAIPGRSHEVYRYKYAAGAKFMAEYEWFTRSGKFSFGGGYEFLAGNLRLSSVTYNDVNIPLSDLETDAAVRYVHANTNNFYIRFGWHFGFGKAMK
ncbi:MAG TPA: hypothetical protein VL651_09660 [Bacteroidia bacterium]|jgi:hypothetical protein|nr:hypothetical protein [Bacteroidia bacterium]